MVVIRLARGGANKRPFYHVVAIDRRRARNSGNYIERLGYFNPVARGAEVRLHLENERITHWLGQGAQPSERVRALIVEAKQVAMGVTTAAQKRKAKLADKKATAKKLAAAAAAAEKESKPEAEADTTSDA